MTRAALLLAAGLLIAPAAARAAGLPPIWEQTKWGESSSALVARFGARATVLPRPIDFGDSYSNVVLRDVSVGGVSLIAFFQMDKATGGLKRIQLERQRHGANPPAYRAVLGALRTAYGAPDALCSVSPRAANGYQAEAQGIWRRGDVVIRAVFRDTTIEAVEGCLGGGPGLAGPCGLTGQLLVRIGPQRSGRPLCPGPASGE